MGLSKLARHCYSPKLADWARKAIISEACKRFMVTLWCTQYVPHFAEAATPFCNLYLFKCPFVSFLAKPKISQYNQRVCICMCKYCTCWDKLYRSFFYGNVNVRWRKVISNKAVTWFIVALVFFPFTIMKIHLLPVFSSAAPFLWPVYLFLCVY